jgi:cell wall-associated NlpC family hydrolase
LVVVRKYAVSGFALIAVLAGAVPASASTGGTGYAPSAASDDPATPTVPGNKAKLKGRVAYAPANAPENVKKMIWAANKIQSKPYVYGGGHGVLPDARGYDCSGTVSYALKYGGILDGDPRDAVGFFSWGKPGKGQWVTVYASGSHAYMVIAGLRLDTSQAGDTRDLGRGPRWRSTLRDTSGFRARYWPGL